MLTVSGVPLLPARGGRDLYAVRSASDQIPHGFVLTLVLARRGVSSDDCCISLQIRLLFNSDCGLVFFTFSCFLFGTPPFEYFA